MQLPQISGNWVDLIIIAILIFYAVEGYAMGLVRGVSDFLGFILSFAIALNFYDKTAGLLVGNFSLTRGIANAMGFFLTALASEILLMLVISFILHRLLKVIPADFLLNRINRWLGIAPAVSSALVLISFFLTLIMTLPLSPFLKSSVSHSQIGSYLTVQTIGWEKTVNQIFGKALSEAVNFLTIERGSDQRISLNFKVTKFSIDAEAEQTMFKLVNEERVKRGLKPVIFDQKLTELARSHSQDMLVRGYFSHYTLEGLSPFDRMVQFDISFSSAGENLAFAPNVDLAHKGLMESKGHRENILSSDFGRVGIGVIDGGIYGKMFVQEFTD